MKKALPLLLALALGLLCVGALSGCSGGEDGEGVTAGEEDDD